MRVILFLFLAFNLNAQCDSLDINRAIYGEDAEFTAGIIRVTFTDSTGIYTTNYELRGRAVNDVRDSLILSYNQLKVRAENRVIDILNAIIEANTMADKWAKLVAKLSEIDEP